VVLSASICSAVAGCATFVEGVDAMPLKQTFSEFFPPTPAFTEKNLPSLTGKSYLLTGGAAGIGKELARILYSAGAVVYIAGRSLSNIEKATEDITQNPVAAEAQQPLRGLAGSSPSSSISPT
jgi:NADPH:quinone reductase-like Zn-dependent oxidoreductase